LSISIDSHYAINRELLALQGAIGLMPPRFCFSQ
jgi:hypothetical protein